ncbi:SpoIIE family protein phosphatase, partial [bacterium AH-315-C07]|nr:SpoIIE family protein phosphatase [bacterium AH-315-C07]
YNGQSYKTISVNSEKRRRVESKIKVDKDNFDKNKYYWFRDDHVFSITDHQATNGEIICATGKGVWSYNQRVGSKVRKIVIRLTKFRVFSILLDSKGFLWFSMMGAGVDMFDGKRFKNFSPENGLCGWNAQICYEDIYGRILVGTTNGLSVITNKLEYNARRKLNKPVKKNFKNASSENKLPEFQSSEKSKKEIDSIIEENLSNTVRDGLLQLKSTTSIKDFDVSSVVGDSNGNIWYSTYGNGIYKFNGDTFEHYSKEKGLASNKITSSLVDRDNNLWFTTFGEGLSKYDGNSFINFKEADGLTSNYLKTIFEDSNGNLWIGSLGGGVSKYNGDTFINYSVKDGLKSNIIYAIAEDLEGNIWFGTEDGGLSKFDGKKIRNLSVEDGLSENSVTSIAVDSLGRLWLGTKSSGIDIYDGISFRNISTNDGLNSNLVSLIAIDSGYVWIGTDKGINKLSIDTFDKTGKANIVVVNSLIGTNDLIINQHSSYSNYGGRNWFGLSIGSVKNINKQNELITQIRNIRLYFENIEWTIYTDTMNKWYPFPNTVELNHDKNHLTFEFIGVGPEITNKVRYRYRLEGVDKSWSPATRRNEAIYPGLQPGNYNFIVQATIDMKNWESIPAYFKFSIKPALWQTKPFIFSSISGLALVILLVFRWRTRQLREDKKVLELKVQDRTKELAQRNKDITDSINYAQNIQSAMLPEQSDIDGVFSEMFILYLPRDIVSGDFYWFSNQDTNNCIVTVCDCTGHGVPGSLVSMVGNSLLNQLIKENNIYKPSEILNQLHLGIRASLRQYGDKIKAKDGMDLALINFDKQKGTIQYAGANNSLILIPKNSTVLHNGQFENSKYKIHESEDGETTLLQVKADIYGIGGEVLGQERNYENHEVNVSKGDCIYLCSDGYIDQFGGPKDKKFSSKRYRNLLCEIYKNDFATQKTLLREKTMEWRGSTEQIDDIAIIGIRI